jgi:hypothetical protein
MRVERGKSNIHSVNLIKVHYMHVCKYDIEIHLYNYSILIKDFENVKLNKR